MERRAAPLFVLVAASLLAACDTPSTRVLVENRSGAVVYRARWHAVSFDAPLAPGASSEPADTVPASETPAWAVLAPGFDPATPDATPPSLVVVRSRAGFAVGLNQTLTIPVDDATFAGDCAAGDPLDQAEADFLTTRVFADLFAGRRYDAATCTVR